jgi:hypothetical protein
MLCPVNLPPFSTIVTSANIRRGGRLGASYFDIPEVLISALELVILTEDFRDFPQSIEGNAETVSYVMPRPIISISSPGHHSLLIPLFDAIQGVPGGKVNILGGHSIGHSNQQFVRVHVSYSERFPRQSYFTVE